MKIKHHCIKCSSLLNNKNWFKSNQKNHTYICKDCYSTKSRIRRAALKLEIMTEYGGKCICCNETQIEFLTIDHIDGQGSKHRRSLGENNHSKIYKWLKENDFPKDNFQILCYNCNCAKGVSGICPHQRVKI